MDNSLLELLYKYAFVPLGIIVWWLFKKIDYRLERTEMANSTIQKEFELRMNTMQKEFELRMSTMEKTLDVRINMLEKSNVAVLIRLDNIKEIVGEIKDNQKKTLDKQK